MMKPIPSKIFNFLFILSFGVFSTLLKADEKKWPTQDWETNPNFKEAHEKEIAAFEAALFPNDEKSTTKTDGLVLIKDGKIIYEKYSNGYKAENRHSTWSITKSLMNSLAAIAVRDKKLALEDSICKYVKIKDAGNRCDVKVKHLVEWSSGYQWSEEYEASGSPTESSVMAMLYGVGHKDMATFVGAHPVQETPGQHWEYSSGELVLLASVLRGAYGGKDFDGVPKKDLFDVLGMKTALVERDNAGTLVGASYLFTTPRDLAKYGFLFLNDGVWEGKQVLPQDWVKYSTTPTDAYLSRAKELGVENAAGALWWVNRKVRDLNNRRSWPGLPEDAYAAQGHWGQSLIVVPSLNLVAVRTAEEKQKGIGMEKYTAELGKLLGVKAEVEEAAVPLKPLSHGKKTKPKAYKNMEVTIGLGFMAKEMCSCLFVAKRTEKECRNYVKMQQLDPTIVVKEKSVEASKVIFKETASFAGEELGCVLN